MPSCPRRSGKNARTDGVLAEPGAIRQGHSGAGRSRSRNDGVSRMAVRSGPSQGANRMIVEYVLFKSLPGKNRDEILADARTMVPKWRANRELVRKHFIESEDGYGGGFYIWPSASPGERAHDGESGAGGGGRP